jgi:hypothetical protein
MDEISSYYMFKQKGDACLKMTNTSLCTCNHQYQNLQIQL